MKLKPCPFCGSLQVAVVFGAVRCGNCGCTGPGAMTDDQACSRWNQRVRLPVEHQPEKLDEIEKGELGEL